MSRIGKQIIEIPSTVKVSFDAGVLNVTGPKGEVSRDVKPIIDVVLTDTTISFTPKATTRFAQAIWGTYAAHAKNMVKGVVDGHVSELVIEGVGYRAEVKGDILSLLLGYSHPIEMKIEDGLTVTVADANVTISGVDIDKVTSFAARIRENRKPEPYKGKGIRYKDEVVQRKQGKRAATV